MSESVEYKKQNLSALRDDVHETTNVLKVTVDKLVERGERLDVLTAKADDLTSSTSLYHGSARRVNRKMKWQNYKMTIVLVLVVVIVVALIVLVIVQPWKKK